MLCSVLFTYDAWRQRTELEKEGRGGGAEKIKEEKEEDKEEEG